MLLLLLVAGEVAVEVADAAADAPVDAPLVPEAAAELVVLAAAVEAEDEPAALPMPVNSDCSSEAALLEPPDPDA